MNSLEVLPLRQKEVIRWEDIKIDFPDLFKTFNNIYLIKELFECDRIQYINDHSNMKKSLGMFELRIKPSLIIDTFFDPNEIENQLEMILDLEEENDLEVFNDGFIPFGYSSSDQLLMISTKGNDKDSIYLYTRWNDSPLECLTDNIFNFFKNYDLIIEEIFLENKTTNLLYKNWGEDFWRVKKDENFL